MGMFVNPGNQAFQVAVNSEIYKSWAGKPTVLKLIDRKKDSHHPKGMVGVFYCAVGILSV